MLQESCCHGFLVPLLSHSYSLKYGYDLVEWMMLVTYWNVWLGLSVRFPLKSVLSYSLYTGINNLTIEDSEALNLVLPHAQQFDTRHSFYLFAANLFRNTSVHHEVYFSNLAIQTAPPTADTALLWNTVVNGFIELALYEDAYASITAMPYDKQ